MRRRREACAAAARRPRAALLIVACAIVGCQRPLGPVFPAVAPPLEWPAPPDAPRIRYVGELTGEASVARRPSGFAALGEALTGPKPRAVFVRPMAVAVRGPEVFVADAAGGVGRVHVLDVENRGYRSIPADATELRWPIDVASGADGLAVADAQAAVVFIFDESGRLRREIGRGELVRPAAVAWGDADDALWVLDAGAHCLVVFDKSGQRLRRIATRGAAPGQLNFPAGFCLAAREPGPVAIVADAMNFRVQVFDALGEFVGQYGRKGDAAGNFSLPRDVATDSDGHMYVLDNQFENVQVFDRDFRLLMAFGEGGAGRGQFQLPSGITIDERDRIWVADTYNRRVQVFQYRKEGAAWTQP